MFTLLFYLLGAFTPLSVGQDYSPGETCHIHRHSNGSTTGGWLTSPNYPVPYPENIKCTYTFEAYGKERVQIIFTEFNLSLPEQFQPTEGKLPNCRNTLDHLSVYVEIDGRMSEVDTFCGAVTPPQLMSSQQKLVLGFVSHSRHSRQRRESAMRFKFMYRFVTNYGIKVGQQDRSKLCKFVFNSNVSSNGTLYSPNYPGFYPRKVDCHYEFHGNENERIRIFFTYFDVEGYAQCDNGSQSDYVIFSNFRSEDRKNSRYCGSISPELQESEQNYFRMIFHSNAIFDRTGFSALYQFSRTPEQAKRIQQKVSSCDRVLPLKFCLYFLMLLVLKI